MKISAPGMNVTQSGLAGSRTWLTWASLVSSVVNGLASSGTTAQRPTANLFAGRTFYDTTLSKPVWYDGTTWRDATGTAV